MDKYQWKEEGPQPAVPAEVFGEIVEKLTKGDVGGAKPRDVVAAARDPRSAIHSLFTWDDTVAAERYRLQQARGWLGNLQIVRVTVRGGEQAPERAFFSVKTPQSRHYVSRARIMSDKDLRHGLIDEARAELERILRRFGSVMSMGSYGPRLQEIVEEMKTQAAFVANEAQTQRSPRRRKASDENTAHV